MISSHIFKVLLDLVSKPGVQAGKACVSHKVVLAVSQSGYRCGENILWLKICNEQWKTIDNISVAEKTIRKIFARKEFGSNKVITNISGAPITNREKTGSMNSSGNMLVLLEW